MAIEDLVINFLHLPSGSFKLLSAIAEGYVAGSERSPEGDAHSPASDESR